MQKTILALLCAGMASTAGAQEKSVLLFGNLGGSTRTESNQSLPNNVVSGIHFAPGVGYQVSRSWTLGVEGIFNYLGDRNYDQGMYYSYPNRSHTIGVGGGLFARYTVPLTNLFFFYTQADAGYVTSKTYTDDNNFELGATHDLSLKLSPAIGMNIKNGYALNFTFGNLGFDHTSIPGGGYKTSTISYNFSQGLSIGVSKNFIHHVKQVAKTTE